MQIMFFLSTQFCSKSVGITINSKYVVSVVSEHFHHRDAESEVHSLFWCELRGRNNPN